MKKANKKKSSKTKRILKIVAGVIIFFTLPSLFFFGFIYFKYNEELPKGKQGIEADDLAHKMLNALDYDAYKNTDYIEWTFKNKHHYKWQKSKNTCEVYWRNKKVNLNLKNYSQSTAYINNTIIEGSEKQKLIEDAIKYFNNDSFWLVAPYKIFDKGVERYLVITNDNKKTLLVTYTSGGSTPGDSYLWHLNSNDKPTSYQMWTSLIPIGGLEASWSDWITTDSNAQLPTAHQLFFMNLDMGNIIGK